jgi:GNAT superfamily N-acetyltransferase
VRTISDSSLRPARSGDIRPLAALLSASFDSIPIAQWLVPFSIERNRIMSRYFEVVIEHALEYGTVDTTGERAGVTVWLSAGIPLPSLDDYDDRLVKIFGSHVERFRGLGTAMTVIHPPAVQHDNLRFFAVHPDFQGRRIGSSLLLRHHTQLDWEGIPAAVTAWTPRSATMLRKRWYNPLGDPVSLGPDCAELMFPMWREPERSSQGRSWLRHTPPESEADSPFN